MHPGSERCKEQTVASRHLERPCGEPSRVRLSVACAGKRVFRSSSRLVTAPASTATQVIGDRIGRASREEDLPVLAGRAARPSDVGAAALRRNAALPPRRASGGFENGGRAAFDALASELFAARRLRDATTRGLAAARCAISGSPGNLVVAARLSAGAGAGEPRLHVTGPGGFRGAGHSRTVTRAQQERGVNLQGAVPHFRVPATRATTFG
jgi:hypothetical protein